MLDSYPHREYPEHSRSSRHVLSERQCLVQHATRVLALMQRWLMFLFMLPAMAASAQQVVGCGSVESGAWGPFDYRTQKENLAIVENVHFTRRIENLEPERGNPPGDDLRYTLGAYPNHPRALRAMARLAEREKREKPTGAAYTITCYFDRAIRFRPDDGTVRMIYGVFLGRRGAKTQAIEQLEIARNLVGDDPNLHYNMGLVYFDLKDFPRSLEHAHKAYSLGFPLPGLKNKLQKAGKWQEPTTASSDAARQTTAPEESKTQ